MPLFMRFKLRPLLISVLISILYGLSAQWVIQLPSHDIPITLQSLFILSLSAFQRPGYAFLSASIYIGMGLAGFPVFANGASGLHILTGKSAGYIIGFLPAAWFVASYIHIKEIRKYFGILIISLIGTSMILCCGYIILSFHIGMMKAFLKGIFPFIPGALIKAVIGSLIIYLIYKYFPNLGHETKKGTQ